jgi:hypothetical protein
VAIDTYELPKSPAALTEIVNQHVERERNRLTYRWTMWQLAWYYLNGARRFDAFDPNTGLIRPHYLDSEGNMEFQCQEMLSAVDRVSGQIAAMDVRPKIMRTGSSLSAVRDRAVAQVIADSVTPEDQLERVKTEYSHTFCALGSCGITGHALDHDTIGLSADLEVVHPRELFPFPSLGADYTKQRGLVRQRTVSLAFLKKKFGRKIADNLDKMFWWEAEAGQVTTTHDNTYDDIRSGGGFDHTTSAKGTQGLGDTSIGLVRIRELWIWGHRDILERYVIMSGEYVIEDVDLRGLETYCPIGFGRFIETGSFHGTGLFDLLFGINRQLELLLKSLFNNIRDTDRYGVVVLPQGQYNERSVLNEVGEGLRVLSWQPDVVDPGFRPFSITPFNTGDVPGKTAAFAKELMASINPWQDLLREKGRVDSAAGLGFLDEKNRALMTNATRSAERAWGQCHRGVLSGAARVLARTRQAIPVKHLTIELAGAIIDNETGHVSFDENPLPTLSHLGVTIKDVNPKSEVTRKQEAMELMNNEVLADPNRFILFSLKEGLDFAMWADEEASAYETVVRNCLLLYGNGEEPGEVVVTPHTAVPELQIRVLTAFMASPMMGLAAPEVQDQFKRYQEFLMDSMRLVLPAAVPNPDDEVILMSEREQAMKEMGMLTGQNGSPPKLPAPA